MTLYATIPSTWKPGNTKAINAWFKKIDKHNKQTTRYEDLKI